MFVASSFKPGRPQGGFTLVELMVGLVVGLIVIAAVIAIYLFAVRGSGYFLQSARLNQELRGAAGFMVSDIRRAGYWSEADTEGPLGTANPFTEPNNTDLAISGNCIIYAYDRSGSGEATADNRFGFRLQGQVLQAWIPPQPFDPANSPNCGNDDGWTDLTDLNSIEITELTFTTEGSMCRNTSRQADTSWVAGVNATTLPCDADPPPTGSADTGDDLIEGRRINIVVAGRVADAPTVSAIHRDSVRVRNLRLTTAP